MADYYVVPKAALDATADAVREKLGSEADIEFKQNGFADAVDEIKTGGEDTGANGLYKQLLESRPASVVDNTLTAIGGWPKGAVTIVANNVKSIVEGTLTSNSTLQTIVLPQLESMSTRLFYQCSVLKNVWCPNAIGLKPDEGQTANQRHFANCPRIQHLYLGAWLYFGYYSFDQNTDLQSVTFDDIISVGGFSTATSLAALIIRNTSATLSGSNNLQNTLIASGSGYIYVPASAADDYRSRTNWATYANQIIGIDEDTTATAGVKFTPTATASGIVSWDQVDLQSYAVGTVNSTDGSITPTHDGRLLIRGLDANGDIIHVTYLTIGAGFDVEAVMA